MRPVKRCSNTGENVQVNNTLETTINVAIHPSIHDCWPFGQSNLIGNGLCTSKTLVQGPFPVPFMPRQIFQQIKYIIQGEFIFNLKEYLIFNSVL